MPDRIIRDELLTSERYWAVSHEAKLLFIHLMISADDTARYTGKNFSIRTRCFPGIGMESAYLENLLEQLVNQDLIRLYVVDDERYIFIPRFKQRLRYTKSKYPEPPIGINDIEIDKTDASTTKVRLKSDSSQSQDGRREEKRREEKKSLDGFDDFWSIYPSERKVAKADCKKKWVDKGLASNYETIIGHVKHMKETKSWKDGYSPAPLTYINQRRWEDGNLEEEKVASLFDLPGVAK